MTAVDPPVLVAEGLIKTFTTDGQRTIALDAVDLEIRKGMVTGLIGPDGAGKTTLMRLAAGLLLPDGGRLSVLGHDVMQETDQVQSTVGYMPQRFGLYEDLSVQENLDLYADLQGVPPAARTARYEELLAMTGLGPFTRRLAGRLSGGMKQKLGLACTLVRTPDLLLLDEPTVGVDPVSRRELWQIVYRLVAEAGTSVLLSTAYLDEAERCARVILLHQGRVVDQGTPEEFSRPMAGRTFQVRVPEAGRRQLQSRLSQLPGILDATLQGNAVRLVSRQAEPPRLAALGIADTALEAVSPRFEDAFVAHLLTEGPTVARMPTATPHRREGDPIVVQDLTRRFGDFVAVKALSFRVHPGEVFGLLGANGAGKTTTFRMLCGLLPPSDGHLSVAGVDLRSAPAAARARIGYMSQKFSLYGNLTVRQNLEFFARVYGLTGQHRRSQLAWALDGLELTAYAAVESNSLPLGYKQRLALACAMMHQPDILFLDEPTSGMDPLARREFWARINQLAEEGVTVLITTHFMEEAEYCDRLAIMAMGEILALGTPTQVKAGRGDHGSDAATLEEAFLSLVEGRTAA
ncbi:MAG: ATP-binding cassette domain-containing protein [Candidatus Thiodiazotropha sp.]